MLGGLSKKSMSSMIYFILRMSKYRDCPDKETYDFIYTEISTFIENYSIDSTHEEIEYIDVLIREELSEGCYYLCERLDTFNESLAIFFRDYIYDNEETYNRCDLYNRILNIAKEINNTLEV